MPLPQRHPTVILWEKFRYAIARLALGIQTRDSRHILHTHGISAQEALYDTVIRKHETRPCARHTLDNGICSAQVYHIQYGIYCLLLL